MLARSRWTSPGSAPSPVTTVAGTLTRDEAVRQSLTQLGLSIDRLEAEMGRRRAGLAARRSVASGGDREQMATARILDAGANRAREALRVLEDYCASRWPIHS